MQVEILKMRSGEHITSKSLGLFPLSLWSRRFAIRIVENPFAEFFILIAIVANAIVLATYDPINRTSESNVLVFQLHLFFLVLYTIELILKVYAFGLYWESKNGTYLKNGWNILDAIVVIIGWLAVGISFLGVASSFASALRLFRLLRPLGKSKSAPALGWVTRALLRAVPQLVSGGLMFIMLVIISSVVGMVFFRGTLQQRCVFLSDNRTIVPYDLENGRFCALDSQPYGRRCLVPDTTCAVIGADPDFDIISFDNALGAWVIVFTMVALEGWSDIMYAVADANGPASQIYFCIFVIIGGLFVINVLLAVLAVNITVQRELDASSKEKEEDIKSIEQTLLARKLLSQKFGAEDIPKQKHYVRFLKRHHLTLTDSMEMRLMLSYERMHDAPGYSLVSTAEYLRLEKKHGRIYNEWKRHITPVLDPNERVAAAKRVQQDRDERRDWERRAAHLSGKPVTTPNPIFGLHEVKLKHETITPSFIMDEVRQMEAEAKVRLMEAHEVHRNRFQRMDSFMELRWQWVNKLYAEVKEEAFAGQKDQAWLIQKWCYRLVSQNWFDQYLMNTIIVLNVLILSTTHYNEPEWIFNMLNVSDIIFAAIFIIEMILKMIGQGLLKYLINPWNVFDALIALISLVQFADASSSFVGAFRAIRLLRLVRFLIRWKSMKAILDAIAETLRVVFPFFFIVFLFLFVASIMSLQLFGGIMEASRVDPLHDDCSPSYPNYPHCPPQSHFDTFFAAFLTTFQVLVKNNWNNIMINVVGSSSYWGFLWFFAVIFVGTFIILNIFLGVLIDSFLHASEQREWKELASSHRNLLSFFGKGEDSQHQDTERGSKERGSKDPSVDFEDRTSSAKPVASESERHHSRHKQRRAHSRVQKPENNPALANAALREHLDEQRLRDKRRREWRFNNHPSFPYKSFFGLVSGDNPVRAILGDVVNSPIFQRFMFAVIIISSVAVCFDSASISQTLRDQLEAINDFVAAVFLLEVVLKMFCFGLYGHPGSYFSDGWNRLDFSLAVVLVVSLIVQPYGWVRLVHVFRSLYILRIIRYVDGLRVAVISVGRAALPVLQVALFLGLFFLAASILGTLLFQGAFYSCYSGPSTNSIRVAQDDLCFPVDEVLYGYLNCTVERTCNASHWLNPTVVPGLESSSSFDSLPQALLVMFEIAALDNWYVPMFAAMDSVEIGMNFRREFSKYSALFFVFFLLVFNTLLVQLFVAVVVDSFRQSEREIEAVAFLTPRQHEWIRIQKRALNLPFRPKELAPRGQPFKTFHRIVTATMYKRFVVLTTIVNAGVLLSIHYDSSPEYNVFFRVMDYLVGIVYISEAAMKLLAFGYRQYFRRRYNWLDLTVCITTIIGWAYAPAFNIVQFVDSFKILSIVYYLPETRHLISTLLLSAPALLNIAGLVFLMFYIYAIVGVAVFSDILSFPPVKTGEFVVLNDQINFNDFGTALLTLFRMSTGENWNGLMRDMADSSSVNVANFAFPYCLSFIVLIQFCMLNLIVAVIMFDIQEEIENQAKGKSSNVSLNHLATYAKVWADVRYDYELRMREKKARIKVQDVKEEELIEEVQRTSNRTSCGRFLRDMFDTVLSQTDFTHPQMFLPVAELIHLIVKLPPPLGLAGVRNVTRGDTLKVIRALQIPVDAEGRIHYHTTLSALIDRVVLGDVINKTLRESLLGIMSPDLPTALKSEFPHHTSSKSKATMLLDRVTDELSELLHLQLPSSSLHYKQALQRRVERDDGADAAEVLARTLLHKAAVRFLQRKQEMARRSARVVSATSMLSVDKEKRRPSQQSAVVMDVIEPSKGTPTEAPANPTLVSQLAGAMAGFASAMIGERKQPEISTDLAPSSEEGDVAIVPAEVED